MFQQGLGTSHPHAKIELQHPAPFAFKDAEKLIRFFSKAGESVLDPFSGVGSTLKACALTQREGTGIELSAKFHKLAQERLNSEVPESVRKMAVQRMLRGDCRDLTKKLADDSFAFILTSPPYWNILGKPRSAQPDIKNRKGSRPYSVDDRDFGCIREYDSFVAEVAKYVDSLKRVLQPRRYLALVVADFRHKDVLYPFSADLIAILRRSNLDGPRRLVLQGIKVIAQNQKRLFPYGFPTTYVPNIHHQYVLIFRNVPNEVVPRRRKGPATTAAPTKRKSAAVTKSMAKTTPVSRVRRKTLTRTRIPVAKKAHRR